MKTQTTTTNFRTITFWVLLIIIIGGGVALRLIDIDADPPLYFTGHGQSLTTDPFHYTHFARNKILFDQWELFDSERWRLFEVTLVSGFSYLLFLMFGISRPVANMPGLIFSLLSIFLFVYTLKNFLNRKAILLLLFLLLFNKPLFVFGRLPYTENGMILLMILMFHIFLFYRQYLWGKILIALFCSLAAVAGKIFGIIIIIPVLAMFWLESGKNRNKNIIIIITTTIFTTALWALIVYGAELKLLLGYYQSHTVGIYGFPEAFQSPIRFVEKLISFGNDSRLYYSAPAAGLSFFVGLLYILYFYSRDRLKNETVVPVFVIWFVAALLIFMPENYRPLRYIYMLYFPMAGLACYVLSNYDKKPEKPPRHGWPYYIMLFVLFWLFFDQILYNLFFDNQFQSKHALLVWWSLPPALLILILDWKFKLLRFLVTRKFGYFAMTAICLFNIWNFGYEYRLWQERKSYNLSQAAVDLGQILGDNAVICGPIAPTLLSENKLKGVIYAVGISEQDRDFFKKRPITHFIAAADGSSVITDIFPELLPAEPVAYYWLRDVKFVIVRIAELTGNREAARYRMTDYESARQFLSHQVYDSALYYIERFAFTNQDNKSTLKILGDLYPMAGQVERGKQALQRAVKLYPRDFSVHLALAIYYQKRYLAENDRQYLFLANKSYKDAALINPFQTDEMSAIIKKLADIK